MAPTLDLARNALGLDLGDAEMLLLLAAAGLGLLLLAVLALQIAGLAGRRRRARAAEADRQLLEARIAEANRSAEAALAELKGRLATMAEMGAARQSELAQRLDQRLDHVSERLGEGLTGVSLRLGDGLQGATRQLSESLEAVTQRLSTHLSDTGLKLGSSLSEVNARTSDSLLRLYERLAVIEGAQSHISELSSQVVSLKDVLGNKQARGAFGQVRMEAIIEDGLPAGCYQFQATLSNGRRPDCLVRLPSSPATLVIDAKFPLEGFEALRTARGEEERTAARERVRTAIGRHIDDVAGKYLLPGETQDLALLFVPSESVTAELHDSFPELIQRAHRARVVIVSPNMLMLAVQTMQAILKDVRMREQASLIQREVGHLVGDVGRLAERVRELDKHFGLAARDIERIVASTDKLVARGARIEAVELEEGGSRPAEPRIDPEPRPRRVAAAASGPNDGGPDVQPGPEK